jgi:NTE family protein
MKNAGVSNGRRSSGMPRREAFVLGAGGHAASAWEIGLIAGMADSGLDLREAELLN